MSVCDPLNISVVGGKLFCSTVTLCDRFPRIVFSLVKQKVSGEQEQVLVAMEFTDQVSSFVELKLLWNQLVGNKIVKTRYLRYDGDIVLVLGLHPCTRTVISHNILSLGYNYYLVLVLFPKTEHDSKVGKTLLSFKVIIIYKP